MEAWWSSLAVRRLFKILQQGVEGGHGMGGTAGDIKIHRDKAVEISNNILTAVKGTA